MKRALGTLLVLAATATTALAQAPDETDAPPPPPPDPVAEPAPPPPPPAPPPPPPASQPAIAPAPPGPVDVEPAAVTQSVLPNLMSTRVGTTVDVRLDYSDISGADVAILNTFLVVQHITPAGLGGYVTLPFAYVEDSSSGFGFGGSGIGNLEVGGLYRIAQGPNTDVLLRGGVSIDTASQDDQLALLLSTILPRLTDTYATGLETTWARAQAQVRHASGVLRVGGSIGFDLPIAGDGADASDFDGLINATASVGMQQGQLGLGAGFAMVQILGGGDGDNNAKGLNLVADYLMNPGMRIYGTIGFSLEDNSDGTAFGIGVRASL